MDTIGTFGMAVALAEVNRFVLLQTRYNIMTILVLAGNVSCLYEICLYINHKTRDIARWRKKGGGRGGISQNYIPLVGIPI